MRRIRLDSSERDQAEHGHGRSSSRGIYVHVSPQRRDAAAPPGGLCLARLDFDGSSIARACAGGGGCRVGNVGRLAPPRPHPLQLLPIKLFAELHLSIAHAGIRWRHPVTRTGKERPSSYGVTRARPAKRVDHSGASSVEAIFNQRDHPRECAPVIELGPRAVPRVIVGRLVRRKVLTDVPGRRERVSTGDGWAVMTGGL